MYPRIIANALLLLVLIQVTTSFAFAEYMDSFDIIIECLNTGTVDKALEVYDEPIVIDYEDEIIIVVDDTDVCEIPCKRLLYELTNNRLCMIQGLFTDCTEVDLLHLKQTISEHYGEEDNKLTGTYTLSGILYDAVLVAGWKLENIDIALEENQNEDTIDDWQYMLSIITKANG